MLKLEAGKRYWRRDGGVTAPIRHDTRSIDSYSEYTDDFGSWSLNGRIHGRNESPFDLVREYTEPQPLEWKRGIPTEEECRECWIVMAGDRNKPKSDGVVFAPDELKYDRSERLDGDEWYLALKVKPVKPPKPKTKTVTLCRLTHRNGGELWWPDGDVFATFYQWEKTGETKTVEVPCE